MSPALFFREHSQEKPIFSFSSKPVPQQSPQPHESTSGLLHLDPEPEEYTTLQTRRKAVIISRYPQQLLNPKSDPWPDIPSLRHSLPLQSGRRYQSLSLPSPSSQKKPLSPFQQQRSQSIRQQLPKSDPTCDFQPFSHPPPWQKGRRHHPRALRIESVPSFPSQNRPLSTLSQESSHTHPPPLSRPDYEESVEYTGSSFTYDSPNGISLHFQEAAECGAAIKISIKVVNDDYILPKGYEDMDLVSSMFKITASADLPAPVTVRMEHCAVVEEDGSLVHMIAHGPPPYKFKPLESGKFPIGECYGEIEMKKFCTLTQSQKLKTPMSLSVHIFYHDHHRSATFVATKNLPNLNEALKRELDAVRVSKISMSCNNSTKKIILTVPVTQRGWLVEPEFEPAQIETRLIQTYRPGKVPPTVPLNMRWTGDGSPVEESVSIKIKGVLLKSFKLHCKPEHSSLHGLTPSAIQSQQHTPHEAEPSPSTQPASPLSPPLPSPSGSDVSHTSTAPPTPQHRHESSLSQSIALFRSLLQTPPMPSPHHSQGCPSIPAQPATPVPQKPSLTPLESQPSAPHSTSFLQPHTIPVEPIYSSDNQDWTTK